MTAQTALPSSQFDVAKEWMTSDVHVIKELELHVDGGSGCRAMCHVKTNRKEKKIISIGGEEGIEEGVDLVKLIVWQALRQISDRGEPSQVDRNMEERDPSAIHIMQMVVGSKSPRFQMVFLKSLLMHHFEKGEPNAAPIHLHFLTDKATRFIVEGILESWRLNKIRLTFYPAEPIQVATMKMYLPEILNSTVAKVSGQVLEATDASLTSYCKHPLKNILRDLITERVLLLDSDAVFMTDVAELWRHFDQFGKYQFLGMAIEQAAMPFDFTRFGGEKRSFGYNAGIMMWYMQRLTQTKWDAIWQPTLKRAMVVYTWLPAAEQTLINAVILDNPDIFYALPCTWNLQMYEAGHSEDCLTTWNRPPGDNIPEPKLLHADRQQQQQPLVTLQNVRSHFHFADVSHIWNTGDGTRIGSFITTSEITIISVNICFAALVVDITKRYIAIRSQYHRQNGYQFRHRPIEAPVFDFRGVMNRLHPHGQVVSATKLCQSRWQVFTPWCDDSKHFLFTLDHRIHPLYFQRIQGSCSKVNGFISVAVHATDEEAHNLLVRIDSSIELKDRSNILYHIVYRNSSFHESAALHNTAVVYAPTRRVLLIPHAGVNVAELNRVVKANLLSKALVVSATRDCVLILLLETGIALLVSSGG
ncbi:conserved hypothetical protein [Echinococcus multilocularis]|uniref:Glycosyltransferase protein LARGE1 n=1 Tax=Echinococcus multilocularis TaxID=6211 RepID=A0A068YA28_ECHMU|nr:conserved hypothetical protein [Echinococcus multilocularis]